MSIRILTLATAAATTLEGAVSGIPTPAAIGDAPAGSRPLVEAVKKQLGVVPNLFRLVSNSPAALQGYLGLSSALSKGAPPAATRERIALAVAIGFPAVAATHGRSSVTWRVS